MSRLRLPTFIKLVKVLRSSAVSQGWAAMFLNGIFRILNGKQVVSERGLGEILPKRSIPET